MAQTNQRRGMTLIEVICTLLLIVLAIGILLPAIGVSRRTARSMANNTQLRGIHQGLVTYAQSNKKGGNDGYFPGLDSSGNVVPDGADTGHSGDGTVPGVALWMMLEGNYFTPEYMISPADTHAVELMIPVGGPIPPVTHENFSYAFQSLAGHPAERGEWKNTLNTAAPIAGARAIGTGPANISSVWTDPGSGDWRGGVVRNDNRTGFETNPVLTDTQYGSQPPNPTDDIFQNMTRYFKRCPFWHEYAAIPVPKWTSSPFYERCRLI